MKIHILDIAIPQKMIEAIGLKESIIFYAILKIQETHEIDPTEKGFFLCTIEQLHKESSFTKYQQARLLGKLKDLALIETIKAGIPAKRFIHVNPAYQIIIENIKIKGDRIKDKLNVAPKRNS